ncbi:hypothetical protein O1611_g3731 [Lasiodiplodia mahajangana]|uniref:Uncharacterized protein n=1 Tax=Lasiodiplodia mahajangana TaxID=1108764 RepID=A0ACC2JQY7_9PEZI|nr:hypothetical protein O1611_g3731 [Lasiodiplodia mahajangana]
MALFKLIGTTLFTEYYAVTASIGTGEEVPICAIGIEIPLPLLGVVLTNTVLTANRTYESLEEERQQAQLNNPKSKWSMLGNLLLYQG